MSDKEITEAPLPRWSAINGFYEAMGGKHGCEIARLIPRDAFENSNVPSKIVAKIMYSFYKELKKQGKINVIVYHDGDALNNVLTVVDAANEWNVATSRLKVYCRGIQSSGRPAYTRFAEDEARQSGKIWLIKRSAMVRLFGPSTKMRKAAAARRKAETKKEE